MAFVNGRCPLCGEMIRVPDDTSNCFCPSCGKQIMTSAAIAFVSSSQASTAASTVASTVQGTSGETVSPLLNGWKTQSGYVAAGIIVGVLINGSLNSLSSNVTNYNTILVLFLVSLACSLACLAYALFVYPTFFKSEPLVKSNATASFLNGLAGGVIFGCLWCSNMTSRKKGISHIVYAILIVVVAVLSFFVA